MSGYMLLEESGLINGTEEYRIKHKKYLEEEEHAYSGSNIRKTISTAGTLPETYAE